MTDTHTPPITDLPPSISKLAAQLGLHTECGEIMLSEDQGKAEFATLCIDRWLTARSGQIRMEIRIIQRENHSTTWFAGESSTSAPLSEVEALQLVNHWGVTARHIQNLISQSAAEESKRADAFGPRPPHPWEIQAEKPQDRQRG